MPLDNNIIELILHIRQYPNVKSFYFNFHVDKWLGSNTIMLLSPDSIGVYINSLAAAWTQKDCGLPNDAGLISKLTRLDKEYVEIHLPILISRECFFEFENRLYNLTLLMQRKEMIANSRIKSLAGRASGEARKAEGLKTEFPESFSLSDDVIYFADKNCLRYPADVIASFRRHALKHGLRYSNWDAAFKDYLMRNIEVRPMGKTDSQRHKKLSDIQSIIDKGGFINEASLIYLPSAMRAGLVLDAKHFDETGRKRFNKPIDKLIEEGNDEPETPIS